MRLLFVTQIVDQNDPVLGFVHHWLEVFSQQYEHIHVICLKEGTHALPPNVTVHSLGKERGGNRLLYALRFLKLSYGLHKEYDAVLVHMNPEYVLLAGDFWRITGKRVALWYNHQVGSLSLRLAQPWVHVIFHTSPYAYPARYKNATRMPAGIDTGLFSPQTVHKKENSIYFQGRIAPAKRVHLILRALRLLRERGIDATLTLVGPEDEVYGASLRTEFSDLIERGAVVYIGPKRNEETPALYSAHMVAVNLTDAGNFDKTVLEALACKTLSVVASDAFAGLVPEETTLVTRDEEALATMLQTLFTLPEDTYERLTEEGRRAVEEFASLSALVRRLREVLSAEGADMRK